MANYPSKETKLQFKLHPRVFAALGADLITNDVVAVIELVKNSYDALATRVDVRFGAVNKKVIYLEIEDNGYGMDWKTIEDVWCMVATPFRSNNPISKKWGITRRTSGEKGLGRLSVARLGSNLEMLTKTEHEPCWKVSVDWSNLASKKSVDSCFVDAGPNDGEMPFKKTGTRIRVYDLKSEWDEDKISDLRDNLNRLISPFAKFEDFKIFLSTPESAHESEQVEISSPKFLSKPKYLIKGRVDSKGTVKAKYRFSPIRTGTGKRRTATLKLIWEQIVKSNEELLKKFEGKAPQCGPFDFEIRAWDIAFEDTEEIASAFDENKSRIRKAIKAHKGVSVYRDGILVLPKSEDARDWLGLDLRRISKVGTRLSTSQLVGYVSISAENNPQLQDKSDREGLGANDAVVAFQAILNAIVYQLENERDKDRIKPSDEEKLMDLFEDLTADDLLADMVTIADEGAPAKDAIPLLENFSKKIESVKAAIKKRFVYYSRLATVGTIAQMLVHEIRNRTTVFGSFVRYVSKHVKADSALASKVEQAMSAIVSMEQLADTFAPLASRSFRRGIRDSVLEESIKRCLSFVTNDIKEMDIKVHIPITETRVAVDPGELDAILLNLINNAVYWLMQVKRNRKLEFRISKFGNDNRVKLSVHDSGPGVLEEESKKIFLPGFTRKPGGIGMGLTVASELVAEYGGEMFLSQPGKLGGASFTFDMPLRA
jgi:signal transduction histidine kinase